jgi:hypothetical protein
VSEANPAPERIIRYRHDSQAEEVTLPASDFHLRGSPSPRMSGTTLPARDGEFRDAFEEALHRVSSRCGGYVELWWKGRCLRTHPTYHQAGPPPEVE